MPIVPTLHLSPIAWIGMGALSSIIGATSSGLRCCRRRCRRAWQAASRVCPALCRRCRRRRRRCLPGQSSSRASRLLACYVVLLSSSAAAAAVHAGRIERAGLAPSAGVILLVLTATGRFFTPPCSPRTFCPLARGRAEHPV